MKNVIIRTNFNKNIGLGHLFRMKLLAEKLSKKAKITFYLDHYDKIIKKVIKFDCIFLYKKNEHFRNQHLDALILKKKIKCINVDCIIVDDYRLNSKWEKVFYKNYSLVIFDDNNTHQHVCDLIIDSKWTGKSTHLRYKKLCNNNALRLCGPNFSIVRKMKKNKKKTKLFNIMFYLGGSGRLKKYLNFLKHLNKMLDNSNVSKIFVICGPIAFNSYKIIDNLKKLKNIQIIENNYNLSEILDKTKLFVGVSSSIIYELNYRNILSVLFSDNKNQKNSISNLNDLGFNFLIQKKDLINDFKKTSLFIKLLIKNINRYKFKNFKKVNVDGLGLKRISDAIFAIVDKKKHNIKSKISYKNIELSKIKKDGFYNVDDNQINQYLDSKNLIDNRKNSINQKKISRIDHYVWWFTNKSHLFYYIRNNKIRIFFNHRIISVNKEKFFYGGWFITKNKITISDPMFVVKWQINKYKSFPWLAIVKRKNIFVYKLNKYLKFKEIKFNKKFISFFNIQNQKTYYLLKK